MASMDVSILTARNMLDEITALIDAGGGAGVIALFDGAQPATTVAVEVGNKLAELVLSATSFTAATDQTTFAQIAANAIADETNADFTADATYFRVYSTTDGTYANKTTCFVQGDVTTVAVGTGDLQLDSVSIAAGGTVSISSYQIKLNLSQ